MLRYEICALDREEFYNQILEQSKMSLMEKPIRMFFLAHKLTKFQSP